MVMRLYGKERLSVAPFAGAWIEISYVSFFSTYSVSLPSRERGLKYHENRSVMLTVKSLPSRERGLKYFTMCTFVRGKRRSLRGSVD